MKGLLRGQPSHRRLRVRFESRALPPPPIPGLDQVESLTSDTLWDLRELPKRLLVLGGGPIGSERGSGESMVIAAFAGQPTLSVALIGLVAKMLATLSTINSGGSAGLLVPSLFFGTMVAAAFAQVFRTEPIFFIVPALAGSLIAIVNVPFAAILFVVEEFGAGYLAPALGVLIITGLLSNPKTIYRAQQVALDSIEILPGYDIQLLPVPATWAGKRCS